MVGLRMDGKVEQPHREFDNEQVRYEHRFAAFAAVATPPVVPYEQYLKMTALDGSSTLPSSRECYLQASRCFSQARILLEALGEQVREQRGP
jgi:hypothetical protein